MTTRVYNKIRYSIQIGKEFITCIITNNYKYYSHIKKVEWYDNYIYITYIGYKDMELHNKIQRKHIRKIERTSVIY